jgi:hypothetical protein
MQTFMFNLHGDIQAVFFHGTTAPVQSKPSHFWKFRDHTQTHRTRLEFSRRVIGLL